MKRRALLAALLGACIALTTPLAEAATPPSPAAKTAIDTKRRALPAYDGREAPGTTAGEALLWIPRVLLFPVHVVTEYVVRRPLGALTSAAERHRVPQTLYDIFAFGPDHSIGVLPTALFDAGFRPSVGAYFFYDDFLAKGNALRAHAVFGGTDWLRMTVADRVPLGPRAKGVLRMEAVHRPDFVFYGMGPESLRADRGRYGSDYVDGSASLRASIAPWVTVDTYTGVRTVRFRDTACCNDPSVVELASRGRHPLPPGFEEGYTGFRAGTKVAVDSRAPRPAPGSGLRFEGRFEYGANVRDPRGSGWVRYGGTAGAFLDVTGRNRVLSLAASVLFADPLGSREIPFTEQVELGGAGPLAGFYPGRLIGRSAAALSLEYRYPIWSFLDGSAQVAVGNVFDAHLAGFDPDRLRLAFTFGVRTAGERDQSFNILAGAGTETFAQGAWLSEARLVFGAAQGF
jgi:Omp85 superfamily domain